MRTKSATAAADCRMSARLSKLTAVNSGPHDPA